MFSRQEAKYSDGKDPDSLVELREIVEEFKKAEHPIPFPPRVRALEGKDYRLHKMICGTSIEFPLDDDEHATCSLFFHSNGTDFPHHSHEQREWIIVKQGSMFIELQENGEWSAPNRLMTGQSMVIEPNVIHRVCTLEDVWYYTVTIPKAEDR